MTTTDPPIEYQRDSSRTEPFMTSDGAGMLACASACVAPATNDAVKTAYAA